MTDQVPLKRIARLMYGDALAADQRVDGDYPVMGSGGVSGTHIRSNFRAPGIVVGRKGSFGSVHWAPIGGFAIDTAYYIDDTCTAANLRWLYYALQAVDLRGPSQDVGVPGLSRESAYQVLIPKPPIEEQRRIADFLDAETARIDSLDQLRRRAISLLQERNEAQLDRVVRGADSPGGKHAEYPPLGVIPRTWREGRLRSIDCDVQTGPFGSQLHAEDYIEDGWPVVNPANIRPEGLVADRRVTVDQRVRERLSRHILRSGDVVFGRRGELGRAGVVTRDQEGWICGTGSLRVRFRSDTFHAGYLRRYLSIPAVRHYFQLHSVGSTMANLNSAILLEMPLLLPELADQARISRECDEVEWNHRRSVHALERQRSLLAERRQALITAAVAGQIDVSTASGRGIED